MGRASAPAISAVRAAHAKVAASPAAPELVAFVRALARDLARADAQMVLRDEDAGEGEKGA